MLCVFALLLLCYAGILVSLSDAFTYASICGSILAGWEFSSLMNSTFSSYALTLKSIAYVTKNLLNPEKNILYKHS